MKNQTRLTRENVEQGFVRGGKFHPVRKSSDYDAVRAKEPQASFAGVMKKRRSRKNPDDGEFESAAALAEAFHGRPARRMTELVEEIVEPDALADLGALVSIDLRGGPVRRIDFDPGVRLCYSTPPDQQLYIEGGDQSINVAEFPELDATKRKLIIGTVKSLTYRTAKFHLDEEDKTPGAYKHLLAEEGGQQPLLVYDALNQQLEFVGGSYHIDLDMDGRYSAGIRD